MQGPKANWRKSLWKPILLAVCIMLGLAQVIGSIVLYLVH
ncbi:hypothetical protein J2Z31_005050 [Sinorhizobium kostiense]|uniref:Transmembrane protein n=1 Tax=Sinorhizobium kostiense TaxID=76747 RepID=A0ABS4R6J3_9HYPH|nr:hypothetical protein [Sinorhizobium kostiense]